MLRIDRMTLRLPPGLRDRANTIAGLVGEALVELPLRDSRSIPYLNVPPVTVDARQSDDHIARRIATAIHAGIVGRGGASQGS